MTKWIPLVTRTESPLWVSLVCLGGSSARFHHALDWSYEIANYKYENETHSISADDAANFQELLGTYANDDEFYQHYLSCCVRICSELDDKATRIRAEHTSSRRDLAWCATAFRDYCEAAQAAMPFLATLVLVQDRLESEIRTRIGRDLNEAFDSDAVTSALREAVVAAREACVVLEARNVLRLASRLEGAGVHWKTVDVEGTPQVQNIENVCPGLAEDLSQHIDDFGWLSTFAYLGEPLQERELLQRLRVALQKGDCAEQLARAEQRGRDARLRAARRARGLAEDTQRLLSLTQEFLFWRFERVDVHFRTEVRLRSVQRALARALDLTREELVHLSYTEILDALAAGDLDPAQREEVQRRRRNGFRCRLTGGSLEPIASQARKHDRAGRPAERIEWPLSGTTAFPGTVQGRTKSVFSAADCGKLKRGDILVTTMTTPDLMLAIEQCGGIVTDEGGLLCHAAIISRELEIPCAIGTRVASKATDDGMLVRLKAGESSAQVELIEGSEERD